MPATRLGIVQAVFVLLFQVKSSNSISQISNHEAHAFGWSCLYNGGLKEITSSVYVCALSRSLSRFLGASHLGLTTISE